MKAVTSNSSPVSQSMTLPIVLRALGAAHHAKMLVHLQGLSFAFAAVTYSLDMSPMSFFVI